MKTAAVGQEVFRREMRLGKAPLGTVLWKEVLPFFALPVMAVVALWLNDRYRRKTRFDS